MSGLLNPKNAEADKGFLDGRTFTVLDAAWVTYDGQGKWENESTCLFLEMESDSLNEPVTQYYSIGSPADFIPGKGGLGIKAKKAMNKRSNMFHFITSMLNAGVPEALIEQIDENAKVLIGFKFRMGTTMRHKADKTGLPTVDEVFEVPGEAADAEAVAKEIIEGILADKAGSVALKSLPGLVGDAIADLDAGFGKEVRKLAINKKFLSEHFEIDGANLVA